MGEAATYLLGGLAQGAAQGKQQSIMQDYYNSMKKHVNAQADFVVAKLNAYNSMPPEMRDYMLLGYNPMDAMLMNSVSKAGGLQGLSGGGAAGPPGSAPMGGTPMSMSAGNAPSMMPQQMPGAGGPFTQSQKDVAQQVFNFGLAKGLQPHQAGGVVDNFYRESTLDPAGRVGDGGKSWFLGQWNNDRLANLIAAAKANNETTPSVPTQLNHFWQELTTGPAYQGAYKNLLAAQNEQQAHDALLDYENPANKIPGQSKWLVSGPLGLLAQAQNRQPQQPQSLPQTIAGQQIQGQSGIDFNTLLKNRLLKQLTGTDFTPQYTRAGNGVLVTSGGQIAGYLPIPEYASNTVTNPDGSTSQVWTQKPMPSPSWAPGSGGQNSGSPAQSLGAQPPSFGSAPSGAPGLQLTPAVGDKKTELSSEEQNEINTKLIPAIKVIDDLIPYREKDVFGGINAKQYDIGHNEMLGPWADKLGMGPSKDLVDFRAKLNRFNVQQIKELASARAIVNEHAREALDKALITAATPEDFVKSAMALRDTLTNLGDSIITSRGLENSDTGKRLMEAMGPPLSALKEGHAATFPNGQIWVLKNGRRVRIE